MRRDVMLVENHEAGQQTILVSAVRPVAPCSDSDILPLAQAGSCIPGSHTVSHTVKVVAKYLLSRAYAVPEG